jgi:hypothetical protein
MNALVSIDVATLTPATVFAPGGVEGILSKIEAEVLAEVFTLDTAEGRERIKSVAYKVARSKTALDDMGKELVAGIKAQAAAIDADRRTIRDRLDALKERVRGPLTAWEDAEEKRVGDNEAALVAIIETARQSAGKAPGLIRELITIIEGYSGRDWQEFAERAGAAIAEAREKLAAELETAEQRERDAAELAELRRLKAERDARDEAEREAKWKAEREAHEAARLAEQERIRAEQQAKRDQEQAERAKRQAEEAAARAVEAERVRVAAEKAKQELAERKRQENKRNREKVQKEIFAALTACFPDDAPTHVDRIIEAISTGLIPHVSITY